MLKTWLITGCSSGFGKELTEAMLARGDRLVATAGKHEALNVLASVKGKLRLHQDAFDVGSRFRKVACQNGLGVRHVLNLKTASDEFLKWRCGSCRFVWRH